MTQLTMLLDGIDLARVKRPPRRRPTDQKESTSGDRQTRSLMIYHGSMVPKAHDELDAELDPSARAIVALLREENAEQKRQIKANSAQIATLTSQLVILTEQIARQVEQLEDLRRRLFGNRSEKYPTVKEELRRRVDPEELTVDGTPMPTEPAAGAKEKRRKARKAGESERKRK